MKKIISIALFVLAIDAISNAIPSAMTIVENNSVMPVHERTPVKNFFGVLFFNSVMYFFYAAPIYSALIGLYFIVAQSAKLTRSISMYLAGFIALGFYLAYSYLFSVDYAMKYFLPKIFWYTIIGGYLGWKFHSYLPNTNKA